MKKTILSLAVVITLVGLSFEAGAADLGWVCTNSAGTAACTVDAVQWNAAADSLYILVKSTTRTDAYKNRYNIYFRGSDFSSLDELRQVQSILLTAFTTQKKVKFLALSTYGDLSLYATSILVQN
jgi:hypothetical protein